MYPHQSVSQDIMRKLLIAGAAVAALNRQASASPPTPPETEKEQEVGG